MRTHTSSEIAERATVSESRMVAIAESCERERVEGRLTSGREGWLEQRVRLGEQAVLAEWSCGSRSWVGERERNDGVGAPLAFFHSSLSTHHQLLQAQECTTFSARTAAARQ